MTGDKDGTERGRSGERAWIWRPGSEDLVPQSRYRLGRTDGSRLANHEPGAEPRPRRTN